MPTPTLRILLAGSRSWTDFARIRNALKTELLNYPIGYLAVLVHGSCELGGADTIADTIWGQWVQDYPALFLDAERYPAVNFSSPKARNEYMINLGAEVAVTFIAGDDPVSEHCARAARRAGIRVVDYGNPTDHLSGEAA